MDTFVVRIYSERHATQVADGCLRGTVEEISTGARATFRGSAELLAILGRANRERVQVSPGLSGTSGSISGVH